MTLAEIKTRLTITQVLQHYGLQPDKNGMLNCPFHPDKNPSMKVYFDTHSVYCFSGNCPTHGHSLDVVDFIMHMEKCSKAEAIKKAGELAGGSAPIIQNQNGTKQMAPEDRTQLLTHAWAYFQRNLNESAEQYLQSRSLDARSLAIRPQIGYQAGQLHLKANCPKGMSLTDYKDGLQRLGLITPLKGNSFRNWAAGCIIFPLRNKDGQIAGLYGRSTTEGHFYLKDRQGLFPAYPDPGTKTLLLTESIIDAATLLQLKPEYAILALYGTNGLIEEHKAAITSLNHLEEIIFFLDGDSAGEKAVIKYGKQLSEALPAVKITQVPTPENEDINSLAQGHEPSVFAGLIESRQALYVPVKRKNESSGALDTKDPEHIRYQGAAARYQVNGALPRDFATLKITLVILHELKRSRQRLDLYEDSQVEKAAKRAGDKLGLRADLIELDINQLTDLLEAFREKQMKAETTKVKVQLTVEELAVAKAYLEAKNLFKRLNETLGKAGVVGEERNRVFLYTCACSYKQARALHVLCQGASGMGKTHSQEVIAACLPPEDVIEVTRMTDYSFYNYGERELSNKVMFFEDMDSLSEDAMLALREMQSKGRISLSTTLKNETGFHQTGHKLVFGPLATVGATTKGGLYEDNAGRCFILAVDESMEQTRRIIEYQNQIAAGYIDMKEQEQARKLLQNCIRLLQPAEVINPYANKINLPEEASKLRRLNGFFNGLIAQITWLHQLQRERDERGRLISTKEDVKLGIELFLDALMWKIDELDGSLRTFYERLKHYVRCKGGEQYAGYRFGQREIRMALRVSRTQVQRYMNELLELEYIHLASPNKGKGYRYEIAWWDDMQLMRKRVRHHLLEQLKSCE